MSRTRRAPSVAAAWLVLVAALPGCPRDQVSLGDDQPLGNDAGPVTGGTGGSGGSGGTSGSGGSGATSGGGGSGGESGSGTGLPPPNFPQAGTRCGGRSGAGCPPAQLCVFDLDDDCGDGGKTGHCEWLPFGGCPLEDNTVCGCDGLTYSSPCFAALMGVSVRRTGRCSSGGSGKPCFGLQICPDGEFCRFGRDSGPCGSSGTPGVCTRAPSSCSGEERPVCACDGVTYKNECVAAMSGFSAWRAGPCPRPPSGGGGGSGSEAGDGGMSGRPCGGEQDVPCPNGEYCDLAKGDGCDVENARGQCRPLAGNCSQVFEPVCSCGQETYPNACYAARVGVSIDHDGECQ